MLMNPDEQQSEPQTNWQYKTENPTPGYQGDEFSRSQGVPLPSIPAVEWTASEYVAHEKSANWYFSLFAGSSVLVIAVFLVTRDLLASIVILLACSAIGVYAARKPSIKSYQINEKGIQIDDRFHPYLEFRSFSIVEEGAIDCVWIKPLKRFSPIVVMYFSPEDEQKIIDTLANFLPHEERQLDAIDRFSRRMRF